MRKNLNELEKNEIINLYEQGFNCVQIKNNLNLKHHQQVLNILNKYPGYIPYKNGKRGSKRKYTLNEDYFIDINTPEKAYILGFIAADGHLDTINKRIRITVATKDIDILEKIKECLNSNTIIKDIIRKSSFNYGNPLFYHSIINFNSSIMIKDLQNIGFKDNKTYSLDSSIINKIPEYLIRHFIRGYFDGDGNVLYGKKYNSGIKYNINISGNLDFLQNVIGKYFPTKNKYYFDKKSKQCYTYKLSSKENVNNFLEYIYKDSTIHLNRKHKIYILSKQLI